MKLKIIIGIIFIVLFGTVMIVAGVTYVNKENKDILRQVEEVKRLQANQVANAEVAIVVNEDMSESNVIKDDRLIETCEFVWFNDLLEYISADELEKLESKLDTLFVTYFRELQRIDDVNNYYTNHTLEIENNLGITTLNDFTSFYEKLRTIPDYLECTLTLQYESFHVSEDKYIFDIIASFDQAIEMEFITSINKNNFDIELR